MEMRIFFRKYFFVTLLGLCSCRNFGFYEPYTLNTKIPEGPPEYQSGYRSGCRSGLGTRYFTNSFIYGPDYGLGTYQHDSLFFTGWQHGWFACVIHQATFTNLRETYPLE